MKILFSQKINGISGSELYLLQLLPELKRRGYDVEMLLIYPVNTGANEVFKQFLINEAIPCHELYGHGSISFRLLDNIYKIINNGSYDLVQSNLIHSDFWMALVKLFFKKDMKLISVKHGYSPEYSAKYGYSFERIKSDKFFWIQKFCCKYANLNITISKGLYNTYANHGISSPAKVKNIYYGLTLTSPVVNETVKIPDEPYLLITGRLTGFKGHKYLIDAWKIVNLSYPNVKLYIAGDGELRKLLEQQVTELGLMNKIIFLGHVPNPHPLMQHSLFTIVSSTWEGFGLILLESWLNKKTVVAFDVPAMNEIIDDEVNGLLAKAKDRDDLATKINYLLTNQHLIAEYGDKGYQKLNSYYTLKRMADEMENIYKEVVNNKYNF